MAGTAKGFSLLEMAAVVAVLAIVAMTAVPALSRLAPYQRLRGEARSAAAMLRQARLKATDSRKPVRAVWDCGSAPCRATLETAVYDKGRVSGWAEDPGARRELPPKLRIKAWDPKAGGDGEETRPHWIIFMPGGRPYSRPRPFELVFYSADLPSPGWRLSVDAVSGRAALGPAE